MILAQHRDQLVVDAHRHENGNAAADADNLHVLNGAQLAQRPIERLRRKRQRIAARDQHVTHRFRARNIRDHILELLAVEILVRVADDSAAGTVAAVACALCRHQHQDPVRIAMDQTRHRRMVVFAQRIGHHIIGLLQLGRGGDDLPPDWTIGIVAVHQCGEVGSNIETETVGGGYTCNLVGSEIDDLLKLFQSVQPMAHLPAPVVPFFVRHVSPERLHLGWRGCRQTTRLLRVCRHSFSPSALASIAAPA